MRRLLLLWVGLTNGLMIFLLLPFNSADQAFTDLLVQTSRDRTSALDHCSPMGIYRDCYVGGGDFSGRDSESLRGIAECRLLPGVTRGCVVGPIRRPWPGPATASLLGIRTLHCSTWRYSGC